MIKMMEKEITQMVKKFEKVMGPVALTVARDTARELKILKENTITPSSKKEYQSFVDALTKKYGRIVGDQLAKNLAGK